MTTEPQDPQPTIEARVLDANELRHIGGRIETVYQAYRDEEEGWIAGLIAVAEDIAPALHDALLLTRAALAASEQRAAAFERDYTAVGERNRELHDQYFALVAEQATTNAAALAATPPRPEPPAALRDLIRQAEVDRDEQSGTAAEEWCGGYLTGLRDALDAINATPPAAAPSVPDAAGPDTAMIRAWLVKANDDLNHIMPRTIRDANRYFAVKGAIGDAVRALTPAAQRAPASTGPGDDAGGGTA